MNQDKDAAIIALMKQLNLPAQISDKNTYDIIEKFYDAVFDAGKFEGIEETQRQDI